VIDQGIQVGHKDLAANMWRNPFDPANGRDDDGNGYVDDVNGWDFANGDASVYDGGSKGTADWHGTHVMGTIGAQGGNRAGVAGVNWAVTAISAKFMNADGGSTAGVISAIDYLTELKLRHGLNIVATNNSYQFSGFSQAMLDAITRAARQGILYVAAAGNNGADNDVVASYPSNYDTTAGAGYDAVIAVAATDRAGALPAFSDYGAQTVDLGAPGVDIYSTMPGGRYGLAGGTSMAAPHVTGAAALYASTHPGADAAQIRRAILSSTVPTPSLAGRTVTGGRLDVSGF
jgi:subtilisin family serine protease